MARPPASSMPATVGYSGMNKRNEEALRLPHR